MAFNPITMDDELTARSDTHRNGDLFPSDPRGIGGGEGIGNGGASVAGVAVIDSNMPPGEFIRRCKQQYYFEFSWQVPFPQVPAAPLLYFPDAYKDLLSNPAAVGVMQSELDAMSSGVLERIPLAYYPLRPEVLAHTRRLAAECAQRVAEVKRAAIAAGMPERLAWRPEEVNPHLEAADAELLDTDLDLNLVLQRDKPSLTLLQRPLYTDMGLVPPEQRHLERLARIVPDALRGQTQLSQPQPQPQLQPHSPQAQQPTPTQTPASAPSPSAAAWLDGVRRSFRFARTLDSHFEKFMEAIARTKLGLDTSAAAMSLTRRLWHRLFDATRRPQQREVWHLLCRFSSSYDGDAAAVAQLERHLAALHLPRPGAWQSVLRDYAALLRAYTARLPGGTDTRREQLRISGKELDPFWQGAFEPDLLPGQTLRRVGKELAASRQPLPVFPVEVAPLFPAGFESPQEGERSPLAELPAPLHHVVLPGAVVGADARAVGPHVLVNGTNLLVADKGGPGGISEGASVSYHTSRENTFEPLVSDGGNTASYVLQLCRVREGPAPAGFANTDGRYVVYRRLGVRDVYAKAPNAEAPPFEHYVLLFGNDGAAPVSGGKRSREAATQPTAAVRRVEE